MFEFLAAELRHAVRQVRVAPAFAIAVVLSLAIGCAVNIGLFQLLAAVLLRPLPIEAPARLVTIQPHDMTNARGAWLRPASWTNPIWEHLRDAPPAGVRLAAWADEDLPIGRSGTAVKAAALWVSGDFFSVAGVRPELGRVFGPADDVRGCGVGAGVVLSHGFWQRQYGGDPDIVGRTVSFGRFDTTVVGVTAPEFFGLEVGRRFDLALPICSEPAWHGVDARLDSGMVWWLTVIGRLSPSAVPGTLQAALNAQAPGLFAATLPPGYPPASVEPYLRMSLDVLPAARGSSRLRDQYARPLALLFGLASLVFVLACVNLAHLALVRTYARTRELAVRLSIGASRARLAMHFAAESLLLCGSAAIAGLAAAGPLGRLMVNVLGGADGAVYVALRPDSMTIGFCAALAVLTAATFTAIPTLRASALDPLELLRPGAATGSAGRWRLSGRALLVSQVALSVTLVVGALLFAQSLRQLTQVDLGFDADRLTAVDVTFVDGARPSDAAIATRRDLLAHLHALPGVVGATEALFAPLSGAWNNRVWLDGASDASGIVAMRNMIGPDYFHTLGTPLLSGREFSEPDLAAAAPKVAIVNAALARRLAKSGAAEWRLRIESTPNEPSAAYEIVGIVGDAKYSDLRAPDPPTLFVPLWQSAQRRAAGLFLVRSDGPGATAAPDIRRAITAALPASRFVIRPVTETVRAASKRERLVAAATGPFGLLALCLTALGLNGVLGYSVSRRTREIGIRLALGATRTGVVRAVFVEAALVLGAGLAAGVGLSLSLGRAARALLFGVSAADWRVLGIGVMAVSLAALAATCLPAARAARLDPADAVRRD